MPGIWHGRDFTESEIWQQFAGCKIQQYFLPVSGKPGIIMRAGFAVCRFF
jgi:hypothetical protein